MSFSHSNRPPIPGEPAPAARPENLNGASAEEMSSVPGEATAPDAAPKPVQPTTDHPAEIHETQLIRTTILAGLFRDGRAMQEFRAALGSVSGVRHVDSRYFLDGYLALVVDHDVAIPLAERLTTIGPWRCRVTQPGPDVIELSFIART